jgi:hypothetical protein
VVFRISSVLVSLPLALLFAGGATAGSPTPIEITMLGPDPVRIRIALGLTFPCDSGDNHLLLEGKFKAGDIARAQTPDACVCLQQTYAPFSDIDWGFATRVCRPLVCIGGGKARRCWPAPDPTIRLSIRSNPP